MLRETPDRHTTTFWFTFCCGLWFPPAGASGFRPAVAPVSFPSCCGSCLPPVVASGLHPAAASGLLLLWLLVPVLLWLLVYLRPAVAPGSFPFCCGFWFMFVLLWFLVYFRSAVRLLVHLRSAVAAKVPVLGGARRRLSVVRISGLAS